MYYAFRYNCYSSVDFAPYGNTMSWASIHIEKLLAGQSVSFRPKGNSMVGRISSGQLCTVVPIDNIEINCDDIVLCKVHGNVYLHIVTAIQNGRYQISNNRGHINGWTSRANIFGILTNVSD